MKDEKNSQIEAGELSDDDLASVAGGQAVTIGDKTFRFDEKNSDEVQFTFKDGKLIITQKRKDGGYRRIEMPGDAFE